MKRSPRNLGGCRGVVASRRATVAEAAAAAAVTAIPLNVVFGVVTRVCVHSSVIIRKITRCTRSLHTR